MNLESQNQSGTSPIARAAISRPSGMLTPSEAESLRKKKKHATQRAQDYLTTRNDPPPQSDDQPRETTHFHNEAAEISIFPLEPGDPGYGDESEAFLRNAMQLEPQNKKPGGKATPRPFRPSK